MIIKGRQGESVPASDRALHYGDGCFTTARVTAAGEVALLAAHLQRLQSDSQALSIPFSQWQTLEQDITETAKSNPDTVLKVLISRGSGGRGYGIEGADDPNWIVSIHPFPQHYADLRNQGIKVGISPVTLAEQPLLAGIKHLNRLEQVLSKIALQKTTWDDALICDNKGFLVEATAANLFWGENGQWFTPSLDKCGIEGVMRNHLLAVLRSRNSDVRIKSALPSTLSRCTDMFICNSLMGIVPVHTMELTDGQQIRFANQSVAGLQRLAQQATV